MHIDSYRVRTKLLEESTALNGGVMLLRLCQCVGRLGVQLNWFHEGM